MAPPLRPRAVPQCAACLRSYAFSAYADTSITFRASRQQIRGKKKLANTSSTVPVRLLKNVKTFGRMGTIVPISTGQMRNEWFPRRIAEYVTIPELKTLRLRNVATQRDFDYGVQDLVEEAGTTPLIPDAASDSKGMSDTEVKSASAFQKAPESQKVQKLTPERSTELVEIFVPPRLEFYRQPIIEEKEADKPAPEPNRPRFGGAAGDLLAARTALPAKEKEKPQAIYGSVTTQDVLVAVRAAIGDNDEAARVVLHEGDIRFVELPEIEGAEAGRVKQIGEFAFEIKAKGSETAIRRVVRILPQEAG